MTASASFDTPSNSSAAAAAAAAESVPAAKPVHDAPSAESSPQAKRTKPNSSAAADTDTIMSAAATSTNGTSAPTTNGNGKHHAESTTAVPPPPPAAASTATAPPPLLVKKLSPSAQAPTRGSAFAAGYDLYAAQPCTIPARGKALVETDIAVAIAQGCYGRVAPRSGLAAKHFIDTGAGVIDADYRGPLKVLLFNHAPTDFEIKVGDRVAQLIIERIYTPEVLVVEELEESVRGAGGFGSTG